MNINLDYTLDADDYYHFHRAYLKHRRAVTPASLRGWRSPEGIIWGVAIVGGIAFCALDNWLSPLPAAPAATQGSGATSFMPLLAFVALACAFVMWSRRSRLLCRRLAATNMKIGQRIEAELVDHHITIRAPGFVAAIEWGHFIRCIETKSAFLLFTVPRMAYILPKRAFHGAAEIEEFRSFALACVGNQAATPIVSPASIPGK